jgi:two-component system sensor histidine kinase BarA
MKPFGWLRTSLARKISLLFGLAVLAVILVTLGFPWLQLNALNHQVALLQAKRIATAAYQAVDLQQPNWIALQHELDRLWPVLSAELELPGPSPMLVPATPDLWMRRGFLSEAAERLSRRPEQLYYWRIQDNGQVFRFAMAVRGLRTDDYPHVLRGLLDVRMPISTTRGAWNTVAMALAGASGAILAILVFFVVTQRFVLTPVETLRRATNQVTGGDLTARSTIRTHDEFQLLSEAFNNMLEHVRQAQEQQERVNRSLDIKLGELAESNVALFEANRLKGEFLANVSHELRTPLVSIIGFAELLRDAWESPSPDRNRLGRFTENILVSGRNLLELINDLLDLTKIEAGRLELHLSEFSMGSLCEDMLDFVRPLADKKNQSLQLETSGEPRTVRSDSGRIKQILYNLLSNAIKFTPPDGAITLRLESDRIDRIRLVVRDTGPGIPPDKHAVIFEKFRQLDASTTREYEGSGLGLAITRELVRILGGTIGLESDVGQGAVFTVDLPAAIDDGDLPAESRSISTGGRRA